MNGFELTRGRLPGLAAPLWTTASGAYFVPFAFLELNLSMMAITGLWTAAGAWWYRRRLDQRRQWRQDKLWWWVTERELDPLPQAGGPVEI